MKSLRAFFSNQKGNVAVVFGLAAIPMVTGVGAAIDYGRATSERASLQSALDSGALAAAAKHDKSDAARAEIGNKVFKAAAHNPCNNDAGFSISGNEVTATATCEIDTHFLDLVGMDKFVLNAISVAEYASSGGPCVLILEPSDKEALMLNSDGEIDAPDCMVQVNSSSSQGLYANSGSKIVASKICVDGGWGTNSGSSFTPSPEKCEAVADPLAALPAPANANSSCNYNDYVVDGTKTLNPGVYCKKLILNSGARVTFNPGLYVVRGEFIINSGSEAYGTGVTFFLKGDDNPRFNVNSDGHIDFKGPTSGTYKGIVFFQDRNADADYSILNSDTSSKVEGTIYLPNSGLHFNSNGNLSDATPWTIVVVKTMELNSDSTLHVNTDFAGSAVPPPFNVGAGGTSQSVRLKQ